MSGRALVFSHPEIVKLASTRFIPYAGDQWYLHRQKDEDGSFFWKIAQQGHNRTLPEGATRQGIYLATADGQFMGSDHFHSSIERMLQMLKKGLEQKSPAKQGARLASADPDPRFARTPPAGGLVLKAFSRIPLEFGEKWCANDATGRDHMWLTREEWRSLLPAKWERGARATVSAAVAERLIRFHLVDNVRGEPPMWAREHIRKSELALVVEDPATGRLRLEGSAQVQSHDGSRGYDARLQGLLAFDRKKDRLTRVDLLSWGEAWGEGPYTGGAPKGRFPLLIAFTLAGSTPADRIPPQASRDLAEYLGTGR